MVLSFFLCFDDMVFPKLQKRMLSFIQEKKKLEKKNNENEAIKKRDEMIAKNLKLAKQNECPLRENSLESILVENRQYIMRAKHNKKYINFSKNKVLENLLQKLKDR